MLDKGFLLSTYDVVSDFIETEDEVRCLFSKFGEMHVSLGIISIIFYIQVKKMKSDLLCIHSSLKDTTNLYVS